MSDQPAALADLAEVARSAARWRSTSADPLIQAPRQNSGQVVSPLLIGQSKSGFDGVRHRVDTLENRVSALREQVRTDLADTRRVRDAVFTALIVSLLVLIALTALLLRMAVLRPLSQLGAAARRVAGGDFDHGSRPSHRR